MCREHAISNATFYRWRAKYGGMDASMISQMKAGQPSAGNWPHRL
ncbi:hypothetical protein CFR73_14325 [Novacetimonas maltaceti]|nr:hypothetical protein CFR73_14325 [Novacetimonas maltaceti]